MPLRSRTGDTQTRRDNFYHRALIRAIQVHIVGGAQRREPVKLINVKTRKTRWRLQASGTKGHVRVQTGRNTFTIYPSLSVTISFFHQVNFASCCEMI